MGLVRTALIFGAGYVLGHPKGRAKAVELANRPEVAQLRQQAASTVTNSLSRGKKQVVEATDKSAGEVSETGSAQGNGSGPTAGRGGWRGRRLPSFPRRGAGRAAPAVPSATPLGTAPDTATTGGGTSTPSGTASSGTTSGPTPTGTRSTEPEVPPVLPTPPLPPTSPKD